ncbi:hypothetical protein BKI52_13550 [marine bacterium AO1-C]|nr:hypothetical protein BKI52_13550 [marine bacterium AO1-C]
MIKLSRPYFSLYGLYLLVSLSLGGCLFQENTYIPLKANFIPSRSIIQVGDTINFTNASQVAFSHVWNFGDGNTSTEANPSHVYQDTGRYEVVMVSIKKDGVTTDTIRTEMVVLPPEESATNTITIGTATNDELGYAVTKLQDGSLLLVGRENLKNLQVIKTLDGNTNIWQSNFDNLSGGQIIANAVKELSDNSIVIVGYYFDSQDANDAFIIKLDKDGKEIWRNRLATVDNEIYKDVIEAPDGSLIVLGSINATSIELDNYTTAGILTKSSSFGETHIPESMLLSSTNKIVVSGTNNKANPFILQTDLNFTQEKFQNLQLNGEVFKIIQLTDGAFAVAGNTTTSDSSTRALVAKIDANGLGTVWQASPLEYSRLASTEVFTDIVQSGQNLILLGTHNNSLSNNDVILCKYDISGSSAALQLIKVYGGAQNDFGRQLLLDNTNLYFVGETNSFGSGQRDIYFVRLDLDLK